MAEENKKYLDLAGLGHLVTKIKAADDTKMDKITTTAKAEGAYKVSRDGQGRVLVGDAIQYSDIGGTPTIGDKTLTIKVAGTEKVVFSANESSENKSIDITKADLGLTQALVFVGISSTDPATGTATVSEHTTWAKGEVVLYKKTGATEYQEFVNVTGKNGTKGDWELLGDAESYALKSITVTGTDGLSGGGDLSTNRTISHAVPSGAGVQSLGLYKIGTDKFGHVNSTAAVEFNAVADHSHSIPSLSGSGKVTFINSVTPTTKHLTLSPSDGTFLTAQGEPVTSKLVTDSITGVSGSTTASKATAGTDQVYGTADVGTSISIVPAKANGTASKATAGSAITYGNANVGTAVVYGTADVGSSISIVPAKANGTVLPAVAIAAGSRPTKTVYSDVTASKATVTNGAASTCIGAANLKSSTTSVVNGITGTKTFATGFQNSGIAYQASVGKGDDAETLILTPLTIATDSFSETTTNIQEAAASSLKLADFVTFADVTSSAISSNNEIEVAKAGSAVAVATVNDAVSFTPAVAAPVTQTILPAASSSTTFIPYTFTDVDVATVDTEQTFTPAVAASTSRKFTPYTFTDVTVPVAASAATTVATGALAATGTGAEVMTGINAASSSKALTSVGLLDTATTGGIVFVDSVGSASSEKTVSITTTANNTGNAGGHTPSIK